MKNNFAELYGQSEAIKARYQAAKAQNLEAGMEQARNEHQVFEESIQAKGAAFAQVYHLYEDAMEVGNRYIDLSEIHQYRDEAALIASLREYGVEAFTFSSGWSSAVSSAWAFVQNGCELAGMVEINSRNKAFADDEYEKCPAYLFKVREV